MENGKRDYMKMGWDKKEIDQCDVGLGLKVHPYQRGLVRKIISDEQVGSYGVPFTADQRQELERQTIIYKYMMASMPVPPQLPIPLSKHSAIGAKGGTDPEPWRCRRTDGKKWRCSRDVTPDHKYCERHSHKGKPSARSRKPVESAVSPLPPPTNNGGCSNPMDFSSPLVQYNLLSNPSYRYPERSRPQNHTLGQRHDATTTTGTTAFIDAWSLADAKTTAASSPNHSTLPLTLSVSSIDDHNSNIGMRSMTSSSQPLNWMTSWISSPPGGPLAEALCLGIGAGSTSYDMRNNFEDLVSSYGRNSSTNSGNKDASDQMFRLH